MSPLTWRAGLFRSLVGSTSSLLSPPQEKFEQISRELPQLVGAGCEVRVNGLGYSVQRAKGSTDEPTVGDNAVSLGRTLLCLPLFERLRKGKASGLRRVGDVGYLVGTLRAL